MQINELWAIAAILGMLWSGLRYGLWRHRESLARWGYELVVMAECLYGPRMGKAKYSYVSAEIYRRLPRLIRLVLTKKELAVLIEASVSQLKENLQKIKEEHNERL